jgi:hypothetical protein
MRFGIPKGQRMKASAERLIETRTLDGARRDEAERSE